MSTPNQLSSHAARVAGEGCVQTQLFADGSYLLGVVSVGLIAFALFSLSEARYRRI